MVSFRATLLSICRRPATWLALGASFLFADYTLGPDVTVPALYIIPVGVAAWYGGLQWALPLAICMALIRITFLYIWGEPLLTLILNFLNRGIPLFFVAYLVARTARQTRELQSRVKMLEGMLPICSFCKKIRDDKQQWHRLEKYIESQTDAYFSHGVCPECSNKHYKPFLEEMDSKKR